MSTTRVWPLSRTRRRRTKHTAITIPVTIPAAEALDTCIHKET